MMNRIKIGTAIAAAMMLAVFLGACTADDIGRTLYNTGKKACGHKLPNCDVHDRRDAGK